MMTEANSKATKDIRLADELRKIDECKIEEIIKRFKTTTKKHVHGFYVKWKVYVGDITGVYSSNELIAAASEWIIDHVWKHIKNDMEGLDKARFETQVEATIRRNDESSPTCCKINPSALVFYSELGCDIRYGVWDALEDILVQLNSQSKQTLITLDTVMVRGVFMTSDKYERQRWSRCCNSSSSSE